MEVLIYAPIKKPAPDWTRLFALLHPIEQLSLRMIFATDEHVKLVIERNRALAVLKEKLRRNEICLEGYEQACHQLLDGLKKAVGACNDDDNDNGQCPPEYGPTPELLFSWLHCPCGKEGAEKKLYISDEPHLMVETGRKLAELMFKAIQCDTKALNRRLNFEMGCTYAKDICEGIGIQLEGNGTKYTNFAIGESIQLRVAISGHMDGRLYVRRE